MTLKQAVVFSILMENGEGILGKSPSYVKEKLNACSTEEDYVTEGLLDNQNMDKFKGYQKRWRKIEK